MFNGVHGVQSNPSKNTSLMDTGCSNGPMEIGMPGCAEENAMHGLCTAGFAETQRLWSVERWLF